MFEVHLLNVNDESPVFEDLPYNFTIPENNRIGEIVGTVYASDVDDLDPIIYRIVNPSVGKQLSLIGKPFTASH